MSLREIKILEFHFPVMHGMSSHVQTGLLHFPTTIRVSAFADKTSKEFNFVGTFIAVTNALSCFTSPADGRPCFPHDHAGSVPQKARSSRAASVLAELSACFRLRFGDGRCAPAPFLRLCACAPLSRSPYRRPKPSKRFFLT